MIVIIIIIIETESLYIVVGCSRAHYVDQSDLKLTEIHLCLSSAETKRECHIP